MLTSVICTVFLRVLEIFKIDLMSVIVRVRSSNSESQNFFVGIVVCVKWATQINKQQVLLQHDLLQTGELEMC